MRHYKVTLGDVGEAHQAALQFGGMDGVRDVTLIESAIARPYSGYYRPIYAKAAALTHSLVKNHGFLDGNKRTALLVLTLFLDRSGYRFKSSVPHADIENMILAVASNQFQFDDLKNWIRGRINRR